MFLLIPRKLIFIEDDKRHSIFAAKEMAKHETTRDLSRFIAPVITADPVVGLARIVADVHAIVEEWEINTLEPEDFSVSYIQVAADECGRLPRRSLESHASALFPMREAHTLPQVPPLPAPTSCS